MPGLYWNTTYVEVVVDVVDVVVGTVVEYVSSVVEVVLRSS